MSAAAPPPPTASLPASASPSLQPILGLVQRATLRLRAQLALNYATTGLWLGFSLAAASLALYKAGAFDALTPWLWLSALPLVSGLALAALRPLDPIDVAARLDDAHHFHDRLSSALQFSRRAPLTPFMAAQLQDTLGRLADIDPRRVHTLHAPRDVIALPLFALPLLALSLIHFQPPAPPPAPVATLAPTDLPTPPEDPPPAPLIVTTLSENSALLYLDAVDQLLVDLKGSERKDLIQAAEELKELIEADQTGTLDAQTITQKLADITASLPPPPDQAQARQALADTSTTLRDAADIFKDNPITDPVAKALKANDLDAAAKAIEDIALKVAEKKLKDQDIDSLISMLEMFSDFIDPNDPEIKKLIEKHRKTIKDLQAKGKKAKGGKLSAADQKKLDAASEALKGLTDPSKEPNPDGSPKSDLASLTEQARQAADALRNPDQQPKPSDQGQPKPSDQGQPKPSDQGQPKPSDQGQPKDPANDKGQPQDPSADNGQPKPSPDGQPKDPSEDPANDPSKAPQQAASKPPEPKKNLPDQLRDVEQKKRDQRAQDKLNDLQERLNEESRRAQNEARPADQKPSQMQDFLDRARGQEPKDPQSAGQDDPQNPQDPQGSQQGAPKGSDKSSAQDPKNPKPGQGDQRADSTKPGDPTNLPAEQDADKTSGQASSAQNGNNPKGTQDPGKGDASKFSPSDGDEVKIGGVDNGEGPKEPTADVIKDAAHSGFATTSYQDIHTQYTRYAEEAMDRDKVPPGYRHYIHLYFDYIGPRQNPSSTPSP